MTAIATQLVLVVVVLSGFFVGPGLAILFLLLRKARRRARRRSPLGINLLRGPGHTLRERLEEVTNDLTWDIVAVTAFPLMMLALFLAQAHERDGGLPSMLHLAPIYLIAVVLTIAYMVRKMVKRGDELDNLKTGYDAEVAVGQELDRLMRQGALVFHDFPAEGFNLDHLVLAPHGVYVVETKGYTKLMNLKGREGATVQFDGQALRFPAWTTSAELEQAQRQAEWFSKWASSAVGDKVEALPVLALPGWYVDRRGDGPVAVFSGRELAGLLRSDLRRPLPPALLERIAHQVEQRCRDVVPTYKREPK